MSFGHDLDFGHDSIYKHIHETAAYAVQHASTDVTVSTAQLHSNDHASPGDIATSAKQAPHSTAPRSFTLSHNASFDFGHLPPTVIEKHGDNYSTVTKTWDSHTDSHTGTGSSSWSFSSSSASADASPKIESSTNS